jgi:hypothetical protein
MHSNIWHAKMKITKKIQASAISSCWGNCDETLLYTLRTSARINRKSTSDSYKNESHHMTCQKEECAKVMSSCWENCDENLLRIDRQTTVKQYTPSPSERGYNKIHWVFYITFVFECFIEHKLLRQTLLVTNRITSATLSSASHITGTYM